MLDQEFLDKMKSELLKMRAEILQHLKSDDDDYRSIVDDEAPKDPVDAASDDVDKSNLEALGAVELKRLRMIETALSRMESGLYGICADTGKPIPRARLEAIPYAILSVEAQAAREKGRK